MTPCVTGGKTFDMSAVVSGDTARNSNLSPPSQRGWNAADEAAALASPWFKGGGAGWLVVTIARKTVKRGSGQVMRQTAAGPATMELRE
jgi:hypothetical protein